VTIEYTQFEVEHFQDNVLLFDVVDQILVSKYVVYVQRTQCLSRIRDKIEELDRSE
jgi:hypothetical protein